MNYSLIILFISTLAILSPVQVQARMSRNTVAIIDGAPLSKKEFDRRYLENIKNFKFVTPTKSVILNDIVNFELGLKEAKRLGLHKRASVQERMNYVLYESLIKEVLGKRINNIQVSDKEVLSFCKRFPELRTSHIYIPLTITPLSVEKREARKKASQALRNIKSGMSFKDAVSKYSTGYAVPVGGDIGYQMKDRLDPAYYAAARKLKVGQYTKKAIRSQFGLHIIKLIEKKPCKRVNMAEWKRMIYDEKRSKIQRRYLAKLRSKAKVEINHQLVKK